MTNDTSTLNGALSELGETMASNLVSMGVTTATPNDGLTTLTGKILDIAPSVGGITPVVSIDFDTPSSVTAGGTLLLSVTVNADYDDTSLSDVDLKGYLQGATITWKEGNTVLGTSVSDTNGVATYTISNITSGSHTYTAIFDGTGTDYQSATNNITVTVQSYLFAPSLDGTESKYQITGSTTISNGVMECGCSYLTDGWDNSSNWVCSFEAYLTNDQSAIFIVAPNTTQRDNNGLQLTGNYHKVFTAYTNGSAVDSETLSSVPINTWFSVTITKNGTSATLTIGGNDYTVSWSQLITLSEVHIGVDTWGQCAKIRNIVVSPISAWTDKGVTGSANENYIKSNNGVTATVSSTGTNISCSTSADSYYIADTTLTGDFQIEYQLVSKTNDSGGFALLNTNTTSVYGYVEFVSSTKVDLQGTSKTSYNYSNYTSGSIVKVTRVGSTISLYLDNTLLGSKTISTNDCRFGWKTHSAGGRNFTFKNLIISQL